MTVVDDYLKNTEPPHREALERIRRIVHEAAPGAEEVMTYGMPGFKYKKKYLIAFAAFKDHMSIFPGSEAVAAFREKLPGHVISKGTIQFTFELPLADEMVSAIVKHRVDDINRPRR